MREVGSLSNELDAHVFKDFLYNRGIGCELEKNSLGAWVVWVEDEDRMAEAEELLTAFRQNPSDPEFIEGSEGADEKRKKAEQEEAAFLRKQKTRDDVFSGSFLCTTGIVTLTLIALSIIATMLSTFDESGMVRQHLSIAAIMEDGTGRYSYFTDLREIQGGQVWRLVTPIFLHFGIIHIIFNMMWLMDLGRMIEAQRNARFFLIFVLAVAVLSNVAQFYVSGPGFGGMSGVVYAMLGYVWMQSRFNPWSGFVLHPTTVQMMLIWFVLCLTGLVGNIANTTHAVGLVSGVVWGYLDARRQTR